MIIITKLQLTRKISQRCLLATSRYCKSQLLAMAAGVEHRHEPLEDAAVLSRMERISKILRLNKTVRNKSGYIGVSLVNRVEQKAAQTLGSFGTVLHEGSGLCIRNDITIFMQLFGPVVGYACRICICVNPHTYVRRW